jgi:hypothetical protein
MACKSSYWKSNFQPLVEQQHTSKQYMSFIMQFEGIASQYVRHKHFFHSGNLMNNKTTSAHDSSVHTSEFHSSVYEYVEWKKFVIPSQKTISSHTTKPTNVPFPIPYLFTTLLKPNSNLNVYEAEQKKTACPYKRNNRISFPTSAYRYFVLFPSQMEKQLC